MQKFFGLDSPLMTGLTKIADLIILNFITILCCIPVITAGAAITAMHFVALKIVRDEESYILKTFFRSFKQNFKQSTILWLIHLAVIALVVYDIIIIRYQMTNLPSWMVFALLGVCILVYLLGLHIFPLQSKFENTIPKTIKNSVLVGIMTLPKTVLMGVIQILPIVLAVIFPAVTPVLLLLGVSGPAYLCALLYNKTFKKFEPDETVASDEEWHVLSDDGEETDTEEMHGDRSIEENEAQ